MVAPDREPRAPAAAASHTTAGAPPAGQQEWTPRTEFEQIRYLNAQGGRLATLYGLTLTAFTVIAGSEPLRLLLRAVYVVSVNATSVLFLVDAVVGLGALLLVSHHARHFRRGGTRASTG